MNRFGRGLRVKFSSKFVRISRKKASGANGFSESSSRFLRIQRENLVIVQNGLRHFTALLTRAFRRLKRLKKLANILVWPKTKFMKWLFNSPERNPRKKSEGG